MSRMEVEGFRNEGSRQVVGEKRQERGGKRRSRHAVGSEEGEAFWQGGEVGEGRSERRCGRMDAMEGASGVLTRSGSRRATKERGGSREAAAGRRKERRASDEEEEGVVRGESVLGSREQRPVVMLAEMGRQRGRRGEETSREVAGVGSRGVEAMLDLEQQEQEQYHQHHQHYRHQHQLHHQHEQQQQQQQQQEPRHHQHHHDHVHKEEKPSRRLSSSRSSAPTSAEIDIVAFNASSSSSFSSSAFVGLLSPVQPSNACHVSSECHVIADYRADGTLEQEADISREDGFWMERRGMVRAGSEGAQQRGAEGGKRLGREGRRCSAGDEGQLEGRRCSAGDEGQLEGRRSLARGEGSERQSRQREAGGGERRRDAAAVASGEWREGATCVEEKGRRRLERQRSEISAKGRRQSNRGDCSNVSVIGRGLQDGAANGRGGGRRRAAGAARGASDSVTGWDGERRDGSRGEQEGGGAFRLKSSSVDELMEKRREAARHAVSKQREGTRSKERRQRGEEAEEVGMAEDVAFLRGISGGGDEGGANWGVSAGSWEAGEGGGGGRGQRQQAEVVAEHRERSAGSVAEAEREQGREGMRTEGGGVKRKMSRRKGKEKIYERRREEGLIEVIDGGGEMVANEVMPKEEQEGRVPGRRLSEESVAMNAADRMRQGRKVRAEERSRGDERQVEYERRVELEKERGRVRMAAPVLAEEEVEEEEREAAGMVERGGGGIIPRERRARSEECEGNEMVGQAWRSQSLEETYSQQALKHHAAVLGGAVQLMGAAVAADVARSPPMFRQLSDAGQSRMYSGPPPRSPEMRSRLRSPEAAAMGRRMGHSSAALSPLRMREASQGLAHPSRGPNGTVAAHSQMRLMVDEVRSPQLVSASWQPGGSAAMWSQRETGRRPASRGAVGPGLRDMPRSAEGSRMIGRTVEGGQLVRGAGGGGSGEQNDIWSQAAAAAAAVGGGGVGGTPGTMVNSDGSRPPFHRRGMSVCSLQGAGGGGAARGWAPQLRDAEGSPFRSPLGLGRRSKTSPYGSVARAGSEFGGDEAADSLFKRAYTDGEHKSPLRGHADSSPLRMLPAAPTKGPLKKLTRLGHIRTSSLGSGPLGQWLQKGEGEFGGSPQLMGGRAFTRRTTASNLSMDFSVGSEEPLAMERRKTVAPLQALRRLGSRHLSFDFDKIAKLQGGASLPATGLEVAEPPVVARHKTIPQALRRPNYAAEVPMKREEPRGLPDVDASSALQMLKESVGLFHFHEEHEVALGDLLGLDSKHRGMDTSAAGQPGGKVGGRRSLLEAAKEAVGAGVERIVMTARENLQENKMLKESSVVVPSALAVAASFLNSKSHTIHAAVKQQMMPRKQNPVLSEAGRQMKFMQIEKPQGVESERYIKSGLAMAKKAVEMQSIIEKGEHKPFETRQQYHEMEIVVGGPQAKGEQKSVCAFPTLRTREGLQGREVGMNEVERPMRRNDGGEKYANVRKVKVSYPWSFEAAVAAANKLST